MNTIDRTAYRRVAVFAVLFGSGCTYSVKDCGGELVLSEKDCESGTTGASTGTSPAVSSETPENLEGCCSDNDGSYPVNYGFKTATHSCDEPAVTRGYQLVWDSSGGTKEMDWSTDHGISLVDMSGMLSTVARSLEASGADFELKLISGALNPATIGGSSPPFADDEGKQVIAFANDTLFAERVVAVAMTRCFLESEGSCVQLECDIIVTDIGETASGERVDHRFTLSETADSDVISLQYVLAHEFGHALGLNHPDGDLASMTTIMQSTVDAYRTYYGTASYYGLGTADIDALRFLYGTD